MSKSTSRHKSLNLPNRIKYILVDVHGVLTDGEERKRFLEQMSIDYKMDLDKHNALWTDHILALDTGLETAAEYVNLVNDTFQTQFTSDLYYQLVAEKIQSNRLLLDTLQHLSQKYEVCIVSDNVRELAIHLSPVFGSQFSHYRHFYSFEYGKTKADGLFQLVLPELKADPTECLFIDDSKNNVDTARKFGINSLQFTSNEQLFRDLHQLERP